MHFYNYLFKQKSMFSRSGRQLFHFNVYKSLCKTSFTSLNEMKIPTVFYVSCKPRYEPLDTTFTDSKVAFKSKYMSDLIRGLIVYTLCLSKLLVKHNMLIMKLSKKLLGRRLFEVLMRATFYGYFVAGANEKEFGPVLERLQAFGVLSILDYSVEEDLDKEEAKKIGLAAATPDISDPTVARDKMEIGGEMIQYKPNDKFADRRLNVQSARTYFYIDEPHSEKTFEGFLEAIIATAGYAPPGKGMVAVKITGLGKPQLLLQLSEAIMRARIFVKQIMGLPGGNENILDHNIPRDLLISKIKAAGVENVDQFLENIEMDRSGVINLFPWTGIIDDNFELNNTFMLPSLSKKKMVPLIDRLSPKDEASFRGMIRRLRVLAESAEELKVIMMIDAEQTYLQPAISRIAMELMHRFNTKGTVVYNTYQMYLKQTLSELRSDLEQARREHFYWGAKLVRGAYMVQERERALHMGYEDPIQANFEATTASYHSGMYAVFRHMKEQMDIGEDVRFRVMIATHNEHTTRTAVKQMERLGIAPDDGLVQFGQLYAMADNITFALGNSGYAAYKYLPYGPINDVLPYISRRAQENKAFIFRMKKDQKMLLKEIMRRLVRLQIFYKPNLQTIIQEKRSTGK